MKAFINIHSILLSLTLIIVLLTFNSCKRNQIGENSLTSQYVKSSIMGQVLSEDGLPIVGASIEIGAYSCNSDSNGLFHFFNVSTLSNATLITIRKNNYFTGYRTLKIKTEKDHFTKIVLIEKKNAIQFSAATGGTFNIQDGGQVTFQTNSFTYMDGKPYTGTVSMYSKWLNPTEDNMFQQMPGDLRGLDLQNNDKLLQTYGMIGVELYDDKNQPLKIAGSKKAKLSFPIPSTIIMNAPSEIPLWYFNTSNGFWEKEGSAVKIGTNYIGDVEHFTFWNCDVPSSYINLDLTLIDNGGAPLVNMLVKITNLANGTSNYGNTNSLGYVSGLVPDNATLKLDVILIPCINSIYSQTIVTSSSNISLGNIVVTIPTSNIATITGNLLDCSGNPVKNGFISVGEHFITTDVNGYFNANIAICATPLPIAIISYDINSGMSGKNYETLYSGLNNLGVLSACGTQLGYIQWISTVGSVSTTFKIHQPNHYFHCFFNSPNHTQIYAQNLPTFIQCFIVGGDTIGIHNINIGFWDHLSQDTIISPIPVNITRYDPSGGFIEGNFVGNFHGDSIPLRTISCQFKVPRE